MLGPSTSTALADCEEITDILKYVASLGCSLKTLCLSFQFTDSGYDSVVFLRRDASACGYDIARLIANDESIKKIITDLMVEQAIEIDLDSHYVMDCQRLKLMAEDIGVLKGWTVSEFLEIADGKTNEVAFDIDIPIKKRRLGKKLAAALFTSRIGRSPLAQR